MTRHKKNHKFKLRSMYNWHRYLGVTAAMFVLILASTGLALNHSQQLALDERYVSNAMLLDWYNIQAPATPISFPVAGDWVSQWDNQLFLNSQRLGEFGGELLGASVVDNIVIIALTGRLLLFTGAGELIEELAGLQGVPAGLQRIGLLANGQIAVMSAHGVYLTDIEFLSWQESAAPIPVDWSRAQAVPHSLGQSISNQFRTHILPLERVLLDFHSGRIGGDFGALLMDGAAILMMFLALSGTWIWVFRMVKARRHNKKSATVHAERNPKVRNN